jgi:hypothetical protein
MHSQLVEAAFVCLDAVATMQTLVTLHHENKNEARYLCFDISVPYSVGHTIQRQLYL